jgi:hypothetical protein
MDKANKLNYQREVEKYLEGKKVYEVFEELLQAVLINKPEDPVDFMIQKLNEPERMNNTSILSQNRKKDLYCRSSRLPRP